MRSALLLSVVSLTGLCILEQAAPPKLLLTPEIQADLEGIRADSLRGDLSFLASDALEGRDTPSRGLDLAAEYIAAQFRRAGLEPGGDDGYFQTARMAVLNPNFDGFELTLGAGEHRLSAAPKDAILNLSGGLDLRDKPLFKLDLADKSWLESVTPAELNGKVILIEFKRSVMRNYRTVSGVLRASRPAAILIIDQTGATGGSPERRPVRGSGNTRLDQPADYACKRRGGRLLRLSQIGR